MPTKLKQTKKIWILFLTLCTALCFFGIIFATRNVQSNQANAVETPTELIDLNDDTVLSQSFTGDSFSTIDSISSYNATTNPYAINSVNDLLRLAYLVNVQKDTTYARASYQLTTHLDLSMYNWAPIGGLSSTVDSDAIPFSGTFNGNGYSIYGLTIQRYYVSSNETVATSTTQPDDDYIWDNTTAGLFGAVCYTTYESGENTLQAKPVIKLLGMANTNIHTNAYYVGAVVGYLCGNIDDTNIKISGTTVMDATASCVVQECYNNGAVHGAMYIGGIAGLVADGAVLFNCLNTQSATLELSDVTYGTDNATGKIAIYGIRTDANVGGLAGGALENTTSNVISNSINTATVAKLGNGNNVGGIVGYFKSSKASYTRNAYYEDAVYTTDVNTAGARRDITGIKRYTSYNSYWSITRMGSTEYLPYSRGSDPDAIWHIGAMVNGGLPYLTRVNILARVELNVEAIDNVVPASVNFYGYDTNGVKQAGTNWYTPIIKSGNVFYIEQGKSVGIETSATTENSGKYEFVEWSVNTLQSNVSDFGTNTMTADILFLSTDSILTAVYQYKCYTITLATNDSKQGSVVSQDSQSSDADSIDWANITFSTDSCISVRVGNVLRLVARPNAGFALQSVVSSNSGELTFDNNQLDIVVNSDDNIVFTFIAKKYQVTLDSSNSDIANVTFSIDGVGSMTSGTASYGAVVTINIDESSLATNYYLDNFTISADGLALTTLGRGVNTFVIQDFDNYVVGVVFTKQTYSVTIVQSTDKYSVSFIEPATTAVQYNVDFDAEFSVKVDNIATGYQFEGWLVSYAGADDETWNTDNAILTKVGLSGDLTLTPKVTVKTFVVNIEANDNGAVDNNGGQNIAYGETVTVNALPNTGYQFVEWVDSNNSPLSQNSCYIFVVEDNTTIYATFKLSTYNLTFDCYADDGTTFGDGCVVLSDDNTTYTYGSTANFSATCPVGYSFDRWELNTNLTEGSYQLNVDGTGVINSIDKNISLTAYFKLDTYKVTFNINDLRYGDFRFNYNGWTYFSRTYASTEYKYAYKDTLQVIVLNQNETSYPDVAKNFAFSYWRINGQPYSTGTTLNISVTKDMNIQAIYKPVDYKITITKNYENGATINGLSNDYYTYGSNLTLSAIIHSGYEFNGWYLYDSISRSYRLLSKEVDCALNVDSAKTVLCSLSKVGNVISNVNDNNAGSVSGAGTYKVGSVITLTAHPNDGFAFSCWKQNGKEVSSQSSLTTTITDEAQSFDAIFVPQFKIAVVANDQSYGSVNIVSDNTTGDIVQLIAVANNNCSFVGWSYNNEIISTDEVYALNLSGDLALEAVFQRDFNWGVVIIIVGCVLFAILLLVVVIQYIKAKEAEPLKTRFILKNMDDKNLLTHKKSKSKKGKISSVPVRKINASDIEPIPVRKTYTTQKTYKKEDSTNKKTK